MKSRLFFLLTVFLITALTGACQSGTEQGYVVLSPAIYKEKLAKEKDKVLLIDVRTPEEYAEGHIEGALNIDFMNPPAFDKEFSALDTSKPLMIYCRSGNRSRRAAEKLKAMGFQQVFDLEGGYRAWTQE